MKKRIFVGQLVDRDNNNPQCLNTRAILSRLTNADIEWIVPHYGEPDSFLVSKKKIRLIKLWRGRLWQWHKALLYQLSVDAIFYPGAYWFDDIPLQLRKLTGRKVPVIATLEGLAGDDVRQRYFSKRAGHPVYCQEVPNWLLQRIDQVLNNADHIVGISPFLSQMGETLYGNKFSVIPLGINSKVFCLASTEKKSNRPTIVGVGSFQPRKRAELFIELAQRFPQADFVWYGDGERRQDLIELVGQKKLLNVSYPGPVSHNSLAEIYRSANLFVLPANSEGVPKVTQEAAACGLPSIVFGFYEAPTVVDGKNGYVVWNDEELFARVELLITQPEKACAMGATGAEMARAWDWDKVAMRWEEEILKFV